MKAISISVIVILISIPTLLISHAQTRNTGNQHCETVVLSGSLKLSKKPVTVEALVCRKFGKWNLTSSYE